MRPLSSVSLEEQFSEILKPAGWKKLSAWAGAQIPDRISADMPTGAVQADVVFFAHGERGLLVLDFAREGREPDPAESPSALFRQYLDLSLLERLALWMARRLPQVDFLACRTPEICSLFAVKEEMLLGQCSPVSVTGELAASLRIFEHTAGEAAPRIDFDRLGLELSRWLGLFVGAIGPPLRWPRSAAERLARQMLLGLKSLICVRAEDLDANLARLGMVVSSGENEWQVVWRLPDAAELADLLLAAARQTAPAGAGAFSALECNGLRRQIASMESERRNAFCGILRLSAVRFHALVQLPILLPVDQEHAAWKLALIEPLRIPEEIESSDLYIFQPMRLDLSECGCGRVLEAVEKIALHAMAQKIEWKRAGGRQLDMIETAKAGKEEEAILDDSFNWLCRYALRLKVAPPYREALAYLVASRILELRTQPPFRDNAFCPLTKLPDLFLPQGKDG